MKQQIPIFSHIMNAVNAAICMTQWENAVVKINTLSKNINRRPSNALSTSKLLQILIPGSGVRLNRKISEVTQKTSGNLSFGKLITISLFL